MSKTAEIKFEGNSYELPVITGTENENAIDISKLRGQSGLITIDPGFKKYWFNQKCNYIFRWRKRYFEIQRLLD